MKGYSLAKLKQELPLHLMLIPGALLILVFCYLPMIGNVMAFQKFRPSLGFFESEWVGLKNFQYVFQLPDFANVFWNTLEIALLKIFFGLLVPLTLALLLNELIRQKFKRLVQSSAFFPYFLSWAVLGGVIFEVFSLQGPVNAIITKFGAEPILFFGSDFWFRVILVVTDVWKHMGYNMVVFLAAIAGINPSLYEAAQVDGAGRWRQLFHITLPGISGFLILLGTLSIGSILGAGFEQVLILYNPVVYGSADIIDTFVYRLGLFDQQYSAAAAIGLFKSIITLTLVSVSYYLSYRFSNYRIF